MGWQDDQKIDEEEEKKPRWMSDPLAEKDFGRTTGGQIYGRLADALGTPAELAAGALNKIPGASRGAFKDPFLGRESIKKGMRAVGMPVATGKPETLGEHAGAGLADALSFAIPGLAVLNKLSKMGKTLEAGGIVKRAATTLLNSMKRNPALATAAEAGGGIGVGGARKVGEENFESAYARMGVELAGGAAGSLAPSLLVNTSAGLAFRAGRNLLRKLTATVGEEGSRYRAGKFIKGESAYPTQAAEDVVKKTIGDLPLAVATGEKRLQQHWVDLMSLDPRAEAQMVEKIAGSITKLEGEMRKFGYGSPELVSDMTRLRANALELSMDQRTAAALEAAQRKLMKIPTATRQTAESRIVRDEIDKVASAVKTKVDELWDGVDKNIEIGTENTLKHYEYIKKNTSEAEMVDIPSTLRRNSITNPKRAAAQKRQAGFVQEALPQVAPSSQKTTLKQMQGLRSKLLETSRIARGVTKNQKNKARIALEMADAVLEDMSAAKGHEALDAALSATRHYKKRFETGIVGDIRGFDKTGAPMIDPSLTLERSIGREGAAGAVDINKIVVTPEAKAATEKYLARSYTKYALPESGELNPMRARQWMVNNEDILDQFPQLRSQLSDAEGAQRLAQKTKVTMDARKKAIQDPNISMAARVIGLDDMDAVIKSTLKAGPKAVDDLVRKAAKDTTGKATAGLRAGFVENLLSRAAKGSYNAVGEKTLSGRELLAAINENATSLNRVFTSEQMARMAKIGAELSKLETVSKMKAGKGEINLEDAMSSAIQLVSRIGGAQLGRIVAGVTGGGTVQTPGIMSKKVQQITHGWNIHKANQLVVDAIVSEDPKLLRTLLLPLDKPKSARTNLFVFGRQLNAWMLGSGKRIFEEEEEKRPMQRMYVPRI